MINHYYNYFRKNLLFNDRLIFDGAPSKRPETTPSSGSSTPAVRPPAAPRKGPKSTPAQRSTTARTVQSEATASGLTRPAPKPATKPAAKKAPDTKKKSDYPAYIDKIKDPKYKSYAMAAVDIGKQYGMDQNDPTMKLIAAFCMMLSQVSGIMDRLPGGYEKSLGKGDLENEKLTAKQKAKMLERLRNKIALSKKAEDYKDFFSLLLSLDKDKKFTKSQKSTLFVSYVLFGPNKQGEKPGTDHIIDDKILAARLSHSNKEYKGSNLKILRQQSVIPKGTVIFFAASSKEVYAAVATGYKQEFLFYDSGDKPRILDLSDKNSVGSFLMAAFVPTQYSLSQQPATTTQPGATPGTTPAQRPGSTPAATKETLPKGLNPDQLVLNMTSDIATLEKKFAALANKPEILTAMLTSYSVIEKLLKNIELGAKIKKLNPAMYAKIKSKYEALVPRYNTLISKIEASIKEMVDKAKKLAPQKDSLKQQLKTAETAKNRVLIGTIKVKLGIIRLYELGGSMIPRFYTLLKDYIKRAKACLPKQTQS